MRSQQRLPRVSGSLRVLQRGSVLAAIALLSIIQPVLAQETQPAAAEEQAAEGSNEQGILYQRFRIGAGAFAAFFNTNLRVDSEDLSAGTEIDLEDDLGFDSNKFDFRGFGYYRLGKRHRITFGYFSLARTSRAATDEPIQFGDQVFEGAVEAKFSTAIPSIGYRFSFVASPKVEAAVGIGINAQITKTGISAIASVDDTVFTGQSEQKNVTLPVANFNLSASWNPIQRLIVSGVIGGLYVKISDVEASVGTAGIAADYFFLRNLGVGAGYSYVKLGAKNTTGNTIDITYRYSGLLVYAVGAFF